MRACGVNASAAASTRAITVSSSLRAAAFDLSSHSFFSPLHRPLVVSREQRSQKRGQKSQQRFFETDAPRILYVDAAVALLEFPNAATDEVAGRFDG